MPPWLHVVVTDVGTYGLPVLKSLGLVGLISLAYLLLRVVPPSARLLRHTIYARTRVRWRAVGRDLAECLFYFAGEKTWITRDRLYRASRILVEMRLFDDWSPRNGVRARMRPQTPLVVAARDAESVPPLPIDTCFDLYSAGRSITRYFRMVERQEVAREDERGRFLSTVNVASGFIAPLHLVAGLLTQFDEDWQRILAQYGRAVSRERDPVRFRTLQAFAFDCWLLWGPSIPVCTCRQWSGTTAVQYGYGDENNSVPLVLLGDGLGDRDAASRALAGPFPDREFAFKASVTGRPRLGSTLNQKELCAAQQVLADPDRPRLVLEHVSHGLLLGGPPEHRENRYYSAYVWIMFVLVDAAGEPLSRDHPWECLHPFFEHGNIGDRRDYLFFKEQVVRKALTSIRTMVSVTSTPAPPCRFAYACALDDSACGSALVVPDPGPTMKQLLKRLLITEFADLADTVAVPDMPDWQFVACHLPDVAGAYYTHISPRRPALAGVVTLQELKATRADLAWLRRFHEDIYSHEFPDPDERESLENMRRALEETGPGDDRYHLVLALDHRRRIVGGVIADYLARPNAGVVEFLVVAPEWRRHGLGRRLLDDVERRLTEDAHAVRAEELTCVVAEIDDPLKQAGARAAFDPWKRVEIWHRWGFRRLAFDYVQPALSSEQAPVSRLLLAAKARSPELRQGFPARLVEDILREYIRFAMRRPDPEQCPEYRRMAAALANAPIVRTLPMARPLGPGEDATIAVGEIAGPDDPDVTEAIDLYARSFAAGPNRIEPSTLRKALARVGAHAGGDALAAGVPFSFHFWTLRSRGAKEVQGLVSFFTFAEAGFGGYVALGPGLRGRGLLDAVHARVEAQMVRDGRSVRGWYVECETPRVAAVMAEHGFYAIDVDYVPPRLPGVLAYAATPLTLMYKTIEEEPPKLTGRELLDALERILTVVYGVESPRRHPAFAAVEARVRSWGDDVVRWR